MSINSTAVWRVRPSGSNTNGGGYDPGISGAATDYSQQNAAQASGSAGTATGTTTFVDATANAFTAAMVGNAIWIASGAGFTAGAYFVTAYTSASQVTLDRSPGTGTVAAWALGGGWADFWTNPASTGPLVAGNKVYILGSGTPNPASYTFDYSLSSNLTTTSGDAVNGQIFFLNDPSTPGYKAPPDATGGMPCVAITAHISSSSCSFKGIYFVINGGSNVFQNTASCADVGCVCDQNGNDNAYIAQFGTNGAWLFGSEVFSSVAAAAGSNYAINNRTQLVMLLCNIHDVIGNGVYTGGSSTISGNIIAKCNGDGLVIDNINGIETQTTAQNNTVDGNLGNGINLTNANGNAQAAAATGFILSNIISNHTQSGKFGLTVGAGTAAENNLVAAFVDCNVYYNNTTNLSGLSNGPHDTLLGTNPYVGQSTENYALA